MNNSFSCQEGNSESQDSEPPEPSPIKRVDLMVDDGVNDVDASWLVNCTEKVLDELALINVTIAIRAITDEVMSAMHVEHSNVEGTTDVLTFQHSAEGEQLSVDIAVCVDEAKRQASERSHSVNHELLLYVVHGILHCTGFDDHSTVEHEKIHKEEDRILQAIGVGPVWSKSC